MSQIERFVVKSVYLMKGRTMSKNRLLGAAVIAAVVTTASVLAMTVTASAKPAKHNAEVVKLGFITKFPVDFYFTLVNAAKKWDKATPGRESHLRQRQERHGRRG